MITGFVRFGQDALLVVATKFKDVFANLLVRFETRVIFTSNTVNSAHSTDSERRVGEGVLSPNI